MSSAALALVPTVSSAPSAAVLSSAAPADSASDLNTFFSLLNLQSFTSDDSSAAALEFGKSGFSFDPALLVLPSGLTQLSTEDLKAFLAEHADMLSNPDFLASLTPGTPAVPSDATLAAPPANDLPSLDPLAVIADDADLSAPLLIATNLTPADMEKLQAALEKAASIQDDLRHALDESAAGSLALISFIEPPASAPIPHAGVGTSSLSVADVAANSARDSALLLSAAASASDDLNLEEQNLLAGTASALAQDAAALTSKKSSSLSPLKPFDVSQMAALLELQSGDGYTASLGADGGAMTFDAAALAAESLVSGSMGDVTQQALDTKSLFFGDTQSLFDPTALAAQGLSSTGSSGAPAQAVLYNTQATSMHPATQMVATVLEKNAGKSDSEAQTLSVQLDPPELGRVQIHLSYEKGEALKVHFVVEKKESLAALERDSGLLTQTLEKAGIQADSSAMSFDLASGDQSFDQFLGQSGDKDANKSGTVFSVNGGTVSAGESGEDPLVTQLAWGALDSSGTARYSVLV